MFDDPETSNTYPQVDQADYDARWRKTFSKWSLADVAVICSGDFKLLFLQILCKKKMMMIMLSSLMCQAGGR